MGWFLTRDQQIEFHENLAKMYERLSKQSGNDEHSKKHWKGKANESWLKARELKGA